MFSDWNYCRYQKKFFAGFSRSPYQSHREPDWDFQDENVETVQNFFTVRADRMCAFLLVEAIPSSGSHCFYLYNYIISRIESKWKSS